MKPPTRLDVTAAMLRDRSARRAVHVQHPDQAADVAFPPTHRAMHTTLVFICQRGELELKSTLLAASLRRHVAGDVELVACLPEPEATWGRPSPTVLGLFASLGVRTVGLRNRIDDAYPIGNKVSAVAIPTNADRIVFLDSDILCLGGFAVDACFRGDFTAKPADLPTMPQTAKHWQRLYRRFGLPAPRRRLLATDAEQLLWPYFNAGVLAFRTGLGFPEAWLECCRRIDADPAVPARRPHLDQIALPIALAKAGIEFEPLPERLNFPAHLRPIPAEPPILCHYHGWDVLAREGMLRQKVRDLLDEHPPLGELLTTTPEAAPLRAAMRPVVHYQPAAGGRDDSSSSAADGLITGFPRSGTSFLCRCLGSVKNQVVVNEPEEIFAALAQQPPWGVPLLYAALRRKILAGEAIDNKLHDGHMVEDTAARDARVAHHPQVESDSFGLWTKNTLAYAARLRMLRTVMPRAPIVACLRHPYETVASWIDTFPHLRDADLNHFPFAADADPLVDAEDRDRLRLIASVTDLPLRRALVWRHLASIFLRHREMLLLVRYEELASDPRPVVSRILAALPGSRASTELDSLPPPRPRRQRPPLGPEDLQAIRDICGETAAALGYDL